MFLLFLFSIVVLSLYNFHFYAQLGSEPLAHEPDHWPPVAVLTCAKNEADSLPLLFRALENQSYPKIQWVVVNDGSNDETEAWLQRISSEPSRLDVSSIQLREKALPGKKGAVLAGWEACKHELVVSIDADCLPCSNEWLREVVRSMNSGAPVFIGVGMYEEKKGFLNSLIQWETVQTAMLYLSSAREGQPYMAVGRNWAYKKWPTMADDLKADASVLSGDDDLLLQKRKPKSVALRWNRTAQTISSAPKKWSEWILQKRRHASTGMRYPFRSQIYIALFALAQAGLYVGLLATVLSGTFSQWMAILFVSYLIIDFTLLYPFFKALGKTSMLWKRWYLIPFLLLFMFLYGVLGIFKPQKWTQSE